ncbi:hypothetical protein LGR54_23730 [Ancylobacter sp. Lp-2]|uniref:SGNH/GDSL hydrolase family protein n=1 Tax=Ancylobacter sp. Lp-2 TaxID=2881339 RepID=UPI001E34AE29|nr:SGNH/GDSL hydrolase family protein [Ancylobacter sp. Lp-2]MCB4771626.1 hypothetical protein [Ancylobacter sp. Lp-2]
MRVMVIGGSNSVMEPGYVSAMVDVLQQQHDLQVSDLTNISIGANNCLIGLEAAMMHGKLAEFDKFVIEFVINDYKLAHVTKISTWLAGYEGLLRHILRQAPDAQIFNLVLGKSGENTLNRLRRLRRGVDELTRHYSQDFNVYRVDYDGHLRRRTEGARNAFLAHYADDAHYKRPKATQALGSFLARGVAKPPIIVPRGPRALPPPLSPTPFDDATMIELINRPGVTPVELKNSRFTRQVGRLACGESITVELPGPMISLSYLATGDGGGLLIEEEGREPVAIYTCHAFALTAPGRFVIKNYVCVSDEWHPLPKRVKLTAIPSEEAKAMGERFFWDNSMVPSPHADTGVHLSNILCYT